MGVLLGCEQDDGKSDSRELLRLKSYRPW